MFKKILKMRNVVAIAICLAGLTVFSGCNGNKPDDPNTVGLTINNLPDRPGQSYDVKVFKAGTVIATEYDWMMVLGDMGAFKGATLAFGSLSKNGSGNTFALVEWKGLIPDWSKTWTGTGNFPVMLYDVNDDATTWFKMTNVQFTNGVGTVEYSQFVLLPWSL